MSIDDLQAQLRGTLDQQFAALKQKYEDGIAEARRQADADAAAGREQARAEADARVRSVVEQARAAAERAVADRVGQARAEAETQIRTVAEEIRAAAERDVAVKVERARAEFEEARAQWEIQIQAVADAARAEGEQQAAETLQRERETLEQNMEQAVTQAVAAARRTAELELESERRRAANELEAERQKAKTELEAAREKAAADVQAVLQKATSGVETARQKLTTEAEAERARAQAELDNLRQTMQKEIDAARQAGAASAKAGMPPAAAPGVPLAAFERALTSTREIDGASTLNQALDLLLKHAAATAGRAALFLIDGDRLKAWKALGIPEVDVQTVESSIGGKDLLARAIQLGQAMPSSPSLPAPPFARLPADRVGLAVPLMITGRAVAVLYADSGTNPPSAGATETVEVLVRHTSAIVALRTAMRNLDLLGGGPSNGNGAPAAGDDDDQGARRFARLLISEIKLYNEPAVRAGREQRDLRQRLHAEIERAQRLYEERVPSDVGGRHAFFQQELVQTLADGDPTLLGNP
jgi:hypothetical protein